MSWSVSALTRVRLVTARAGAGSLTVILTELDVFVAPSLSVALAVSV